MLATLEITYITQLAQTLRRMFFRSEEQLEERKAGAMRLMPR